MKSPTSDEIKRSRAAIGYTQEQAAAVIHCHAYTWQKYELGSREMHPAFWELWQLKTKRRRPKK